MQPASQRLGELYMVLIDRKKLAKLMIVQEVTQRELATAIGWRSHSYLGRLLRGEKNSLDPDAALRIAHFLGVGADDLFLTKVSGENGRSTRTKKIAS